MTHGCPVRLVERKTLFPPLVDVNRKLVTSVSAKSHLVTMREVSLRRKSRYRVGIKNIIEKWSWKL
jgi:hypothetical protein